MSNVYSMTAYRSAIIDLFKVADNRAAAIEMRDAILPGNDAPIVHLAVDELAYMRAQPTTCRSSTGAAPDVGPRGNSRRFTAGRL